MNNFSEVFFSTIAQISATFMGFALLIPAIGILSSDLFTGARNYIKPYILVKKFFFFISFPLFVLANSLIVSLTILLNYSLLTGVIWFVFISTIFFPFWLYWLQKNSKLSKHWIVHILLDVLPWVFFFVHSGFAFLFLIYRLWNQHFWLFSRWDTLLLVLLGFVLILRNFMISSAIEISFSSKKDVKEELKNIISYWPCSGNKSLPKDVQEEEGILSTIKKACDAIKEREKLLEQFKNWLKGIRKEEEKRKINLMIAESRTEIRNIEAFLDDIIKRFKTNILKEEKPTFTLSDCANIEKRLDEAKKHLWQFQQGTTRLNEILNVLKEENAYEKN